MLERHKFDLMVLSAIRSGPLEALETFSQRSILPPLVLVDGDDGTQIRKDLFWQFRCALYFKREYQWHGGNRLKDKYKRWRKFGTDQELFSRTYPLPFSPVLDTVPSLDHETKDVDISFIGHASHRKRIRAVKILQDAPGLRFEGGVFAEPSTRRSKLALGTIPILLAKLQGDPYASEDECRKKLTFADYFRLLGRSKMGLSIRGSGFDTMRYWEIVASKTLLVSEKPYIDIPNNFEHGKQAVFCRPDLSDLVDLVRNYAHDDSARRDIAEAGYRHLLEFHTCERRAEQFLDVCRKRL